ncbi:MAG TPA: penicillin-binding protein activator LpoB [Nitrospiraceae bacterium]|nr:penicillin-binding protein activator LpoB [Nitrospiraceae bacterium]
MQDLVVDPRRRLRTAMAVLAGTVLLGGCASETKVTRVDTGVVTDLSGRWNDTDSRMVAETMVKEALGSPWLENYTKSKNRQPVVVVGTILNRSHEHIDVGTFVTDLSRELTNSQKVTFVAGKGEREEVREERREQAVHAREDTQKAPGKEIGADYMLKGSISTIEDESQGVKAVFYQVDLELIDLENNVKSWFGQQKIKKVIERKRMLF